jgi:hypothetical protein
LAPSAVVAAPNTKASMIANPTTVVVARAAHATLLAALLIIRLFLSLGSRRINPAARRVDRPHTPHTRLLHSGKEPAGGADSSLQELFVSDGAKRGVRAFRIYQNSFI